MWKLWSILLPLVLLAGCAGVPLSEQALSMVDPTLEFEDIKANPDRYQGTTLLLGGQIVDNQPTRQGSILEILRYRLSNAGRPIEVDEAGGRFLAKSERFLDPEVYESGRFITLTGTFTGQETKPLKGIEYTYPVFRVTEAHLWRDEAVYGYSPYYYGPPYYPYYYSPYYDPFWYGPGRFHSPYWRYPWGW